MANNLTLTSAAYDTTGEKFGAAALSGGFGIAPGGMVAALPVAWECWFKRASAPSSLEVIMGQSGLGWFGMTSAGKIQFEFGTSPAVDFTSTGSAADGNWHHAAISATTGGFSAYLDGALVGRSSATPGGLTFAASSSPPSALGYMGVRNHGGSQQFQFGGEVDEAAVWAANQYPSAFTPPSAPYVGNETGLLALWHLDSSGADSTGAAAASPTISAPSVAGLTTGGNTTVSGTFANGAPQALSQVLDGVTTTVSNPVITTTSGSAATAAGTYSYTITTPAAGSHTLQVLGTGTYAASSGTTSFTTTAPAAATISAPSLGGLTAGGTTTVSGTFGNGAPTGLAQVLDGATTAVASPTITTTGGSGSSASGTYSYNITTPAAGSHTIQVNGTGTYAATGSQTAFTASSTPPLLIPASSAAIAYSPYTWSGGKTINPGAYFRMVFTGASVALNFDVSAQSSPLPQVWVSIDGLPPQQFTVASTITPAMPALTAAWPKHTIEVVVKSTSEFVNRWTPQAAAVILTSIAIASGATASLPTTLARNVIVLGDSITEGYHTVSALGSGQTDTDGSDATLGWAYALRRLLGAEVGVVGFGGTGLLNPGQGGVPAVGTSFSSLWSGQARTFTPAPSLIVINEGENDKTANASTFQSAFQTFLTALLSAVPSCPVAVLRPFSGAQASAIQAAITAVGSPRLHYLDTTGLFDTTLSVDGQHPLGVANLSAIGPGVAALAAPLLTGITNRWSHA